MMMICTCDTYRPASAVSGHVAMDSFTAVCTAQVHRVLVVCLVCPVLFEVVTIMRFDVRITSFFFFAFFCMKQNAQLCLLLKVLYDKINDKCCL